MNNIITISLNDYSVQIDDFWVNKYKGTFWKVLEMYSILN